ncbi:hypothetical protein RDI58_024516 [Solanum bulbocastanum]|uniref:DUF4216 domain-containing protein n=1 Tax=Solanum bulbocastanum TaxID=147425 RepID=A0AAN8SXT7_SOLBU
MEDDTTRNRGYRTDAWKFNYANFSKLIHTGDCEDHDPFIEASQANMVYHVDNETDKEWSDIIQKTMSKSSNPSSPLRQQSQMRGNIFINPLERSGL